jgi:hypothetical protein
MRGERCRWPWMRGEGGRRITGILRFKRSEISEISESGLYILCT